MSFTFTITYNNIKIEQKNKIQLLFENICRFVTHIFKIKQPYYFDVIITNSKTIRLINKKYRKIDKPTDVLSFAFHDAEPKTNLLGEIFINWNDVVKESKYKKTSATKEVCILFIHGLLHLLQYDHNNLNNKRIMNKLENEILSKLFFD